MTSASGRSRYALGVSSALTIVVVALATVLSLWALWFVIRDRAVVLRQLWGATLVEVALLVQIVVAIVLSSRATHDFDPVTLWGYLITVLVILPVAGVWAFAERTRWSSVVLMVAAWTVVFLELRLLQIWGS